MQPNEVIVVLMADCRDVDAGRILERIQLVYDSEHRTPAISERSENRAADATPLCTTLAPTIWQRLIRSDETLICSPPNRGKFAYAVTS
jgi:hypothetical protein